MTPERTCDFCGEAYRSRVVHEQSPGHLAAKALISELPEDFRLDGTGWGTPPATPKGLWARLRRLVGR